jgi:WD40 repeat protein
MGKARIIIFFAATLTWAVLCSVSHAALYPALNIEPELMVPEKPAAPTVPYPAAPAVEPGALPYEGAEVSFNPSRYKKVISSGTVSGVLFSPDARSLAVWGMKHVELYYIETGLLTSRREFKSPVTSIALSPGGGVLAVGTKKGMIHILDALDLNIKSSFKGKKKHVSSLCFNPGGDMLAAGFADGHIELWDPGFGELDGVLKGHRKRVHSLSFMPDGASLVSVGDDLLTKFWDLGKKKELRSLKESEQRLTMASLSVDGGLIALGAKLIKIDLRLNKRIDERFLIVRSTATGEEIRKFEIPKDASAIAFYPNQRYLASASEDGVIRIWDIKQGEEAAAIDLTEVPGSLDFSGDGRLMAFSEDRKITIMKLGDM